MLNFINFTEELTVMWNRNRNFLPLRNRNRNAFRFRNRIWIRIQHKMQYKIKTAKKIKKERPTFTETMLFLTEKNKILYNFCLKLC